MKTQTRIVLFTRSLCEDLEAVPSLGLLALKTNGPKLEKALVRQFQKELDSYVSNHGVTSILYAGKPDGDAYNLIVTIETKCKTTVQLARDIQKRFYGEDFGALAGSFEVAR